jgi:3-oxoacyl-[acyl-carrier-protein] synthase-3
LKANISTIAHFVPPKVINNDFFKNAPDADYIFSKTGISERRYSEGPTSEMIIPAIKSCLKKRAIDLDEIDCIIVATITPDYLSPSTAAVIINKLQLKNCWGFDISAACSGFVYGLQIASNMVTSGTAKKVLLCGADKMSSTTNADDIKTSMIFSDGAGVALIEISTTADCGIVDILCKMDASGLNDIYIPNGGTASPLTSAHVIGKDDKIVMNGRRVFHAGVSAMTNAANEVLIRNNMTIDNISFLVTHQSNALMIKDVAGKLGIGADKVLTNINNVGNTGAATIPICLSHYHEQGIIKPGDKLLLTSVGIGYTIASAIIVWEC